MFQPQAKLEFVKRYCNPKEGWDVYVDIDPSEEGRTGGARKTAESRARQRDMKKSAAEVRREFEKLGVRVGSGKKWRQDVEVEAELGDRDIVAINKTAKRMVIAEVEAESSGQPEQKIAKAIGQIVVAAAEPEIEGFKRELVLVVAGHRLADRIARYWILETIGVSAVVITENKCSDRRGFGNARCIADV